MEKCYFPCCQVLEQQEEMRDKSISLTIVVYILPPILFLRMDLAPDVQTWSVLKKDCDDWKW